MCHLIRTKSGFLSSLLTTRPVRAHGTRLGTRTGGMKAPSHAGRTNRPSEHPAPSSRSHGQSRTSGIAIRIQGTMPPPLTPPTYRTEKRNKKAHKPVAHLLTSAPPRRLALLAAAGAATAGCCGGGGELAAPGTSVLLGTEGEAGAGRRSGRQLG